jgi:hypothetical protein
MLVESHRQVIVGDQTLFDEHDTERLRIGRHETS